MKSKTVKRTRTVRGYTGTGDLSVSQVGEEERMRLVEEAVDTIMREGDLLGNDIIEMIQLKAVDRIALGIAALGLAKALAMVKDVARRTGIDIDKLHQKELMHYRRMFAKIQLGNESEK